MGAGALVLAISGSVVAGYFLVFLASPHELAWHLDSTVSRLLSHVWPAVIFGAMLAPEWEKSSSPT